MKRKTLFLIFGIYFGFVLSRAGASDYDRIFAMFTGTDLHLAGVILTAILTGALGMALLKAGGNMTRDKKPIHLKERPMNKGKIAGGILFGIGWGMTGACPGTVLAQIGEGKILGAFSLAGMIAGVYVYARWVERFPGGEG